MADILGTSGDDDLHGTDEDDLIQGLEGNDTLRGHGGDDRLEGGDGADLLFAGTGDNELYGGAGDDQYVVNSSVDLAWEEEDEGYDVVSTATSYVLPAGSHIERLTSISWSLNVALSLTGNEFDNRLEGNISANRLDGGAGADVMVGFGHSDDYVIDNIGDVVIEAANGGTLDRALIRTSEWKLPDGAHVERMIAEFSSIKMTGNELDNEILGSSGDDVLDGRGGADSLNGGGGNDKYVVDNVNDLVNDMSSFGYDSVSTLVDYTLPAFSRIERLSSISSALTSPLKLTGNEFANLIEGNAGDNVLDGRGDADQLFGFGGADTFAFTSPLGGGNIDTIADFEAGVDTIGLHTAVFTTLEQGDLPEEAFRTGTAAQDADDRIIYDPATGFLYYDADGVGGAAAVQFATVNPGAIPFPTLAASDFAVIMANIVGTSGDDDLSGTSNPDLIQGLGGNDILRGLEGEDRLEGGEGNDILIGGPDHDALYGGPGDDKYVVAKYVGDDNSGDSAWEEEGEGYDVVSTSISYALDAGSHIEWLTSVSWTLTTSLQLTGNEFANLISGNAGNNVLNGGGGADRLVGFGGNDQYIVDNALDVVVEAAGGGNDFVSTVVDYQLAAGSHVERLTSISWASTTPLKLTGNELVNRIEGNDGDNILDGRGGADTMVGFDGNDKYVVDNAGDVIIETSGGDYDSVSTLVDYQLGAGSHVERLTSISWALTTPLTLTGNEFANRIEGNAGDNILDGEGGADILQGFGGADTFAFTTLGGGNVDTIVDFEAGLDTIALENAVFAALAPGDLPEAAFRTGTAAQDADDRIIYDSATGFIYYDPDGTGGFAALHFATVNAGVPLTAGDFTVI